MLNPQHVKHFRRVRPEDDKTDPQDSRLIGSYYQTVGVKTLHTFDFRYLPLRHLTRAYFRLTHTLASEKAFAVSLVYLLASEYARLKPLTDRFSVTAVHLLTEYPNVAELADLPVDDLAETIQTLGRGHFRDPDEKASTLQQVRGLDPTGAIRSDGIDDDSVTGHPHAGRHAAPAPSRPSSGSRRRRRGRNR